MDGIIEPQVDRLKAGKFAQGAFDAPGGHAVGAFFAFGDGSIQRPQVSQAQMLFGDLQHPAAAAGIVLAVSIGVAVGIQQLPAGRAGGLVVQLFADGIGRGQLGHVQHGVGVTGEHAGTGRAVHRLFAAL